MVPVPPSLELLLPEPQEPSLSMGNLELRQSEKGGEQDQEAQQVAEGQILFPNGSLYCSALISIIKIDICKACSGSLVSDFSVHVFAEGFILHSSRRIYILKSVFNS